MNKGYTNVCCEFETSSKKSTFSKKYKKFEQKFCSEWLHQ